MGEGDHVQVNVKNDCPYTANGSESEVLGKKTETGINAEVNCEHGTKRDT